MESIGVKTRWQGEALTVFPPEKLKLEKLDIEVALKTRIMILLIGILIHKFKNSPCLFRRVQAGKKNFDASHLRLGKIWDKNKGQGRGIRNKPEQAGPLRKSNNVRIRRHGDGKRHFGRRLLAEKRLSNSLRPIIKFRTCAIFWLAWV